MGFRTLASSKIEGWLQLPYILCSGDELFMATQGIRRK